MMDTLLEGVVSSMIPNAKAIDETATRRIATLNEHLHSEFERVMRVDDGLTRALVSFQDNKRTPGFRWYRFKEAFSATLVNGLLDEYGYSQGNLLDPFAGSGAALFAAAARGLNADGIEVLPIGQDIIKARRTADQYSEQVVEAIRGWISEMPWHSCDARAPLGEIRITAGAYPPETKASIERYMQALTVEDANTASVLRLALLCVLESVSYTRKDGQYLRWNYRAGRNWRKHRFDKGSIASFDEAIIAKLGEMLEDLVSSTRVRQMVGQVQIRRGSCLEILPTMIETASYDVVFTSPPYCNRYDYTRTYALELAVLGIDEVEIARLRQEMLSCTVENREKDLLEINPDWEEAIDIVVNHSLLSSIDSYLEAQRADGELNNSGIPRMIRGYFSEMALCRGRVDASAQARRQGLHGER